MNSDEVYEKLSQIEGSLDLSKFQVNGIDIWPHLRFQFVIKANQTILGGSHTSQDYRSRIWNKLLLLPQAIHGVIQSVSLRMNKRLGFAKSDILFITDTSAKRMKLGRYWYDVYIDPLVDYYDLHNITSQTLETSQRFLFRYPGVRNSYPLLPDMIIYYLRSLIYRNSVQFTESFENSYQQYYALMTKLELSEYIVSLNEIKLEVSYVRQLNRLFSRILDQINPRLVFLVPYNGYAGKSLTFLCKKRSIKVIDIQHGVQGSYHPAYASFSSLPKNAFNTLPNIFLTWSKKDAKRINQWARRYKHIEAITLGNLFEYMFKTDNSRSRFFDKLFQKSFAFSQSKTMVLITLIWDHFLPTEFKQLLLDSGDDVFFLIRFHPSTTKRERVKVIKELERLGSGNFEYDMATELPLYAILRNVDFHVTQRSSTVIEAANFNVKSIITDKIGRYYYREYFNSGKAIYCNNTSSMISVFNDKPDNRLKKMDICGSRHPYTILNKIYFGIT